MTMHYNCRTDNASILTPARYLASLITSFIASCKATYKATCKASCKATSITTWIATSTTTLITVCLLLLPQASVATDNNPLKPDQKSVILKIIVKGVEGDVLKNVESSLALFQAKRSQTKKTQQQKPLNEQIIKRLYKRANEEIKAALRPFGYYQPRITSQLSVSEVNSLTRLQTVDQWIAEFEIQAGEAVIVDSIDVSIKGPGKEESQLLKLIEPLANNSSSDVIKIGQQLNHQDYEQYKQALYNSLFKLGYLDTSFSKSELQVDTRTNLAHIVLELNTGSQYFFGEIRVEQNTIQARKIQPLIAIDTDTPFNSNELIKLQLRLADTGYFSDIEIQIEREKTLNQRIPVLVRAQPSKKLKYSLSGGYGTDTGARIGINFLNRRINKRGHRFQSSLQLSEVENNLNAQYVIPIGNVSNENITVFSSINEEQVNDFETIGYDLGLQLQQQRWQGQRILSLRVLQEQFSFDGEENQTANLLIPGLIYHYKYFDAPLFSRKGFSLSGDIHGGIESSLSETDFFHAKLTARAVWPLGKQVRLLSRMELGNITTDDFSALPPSERFFTGGAQTVRGYRYKDIGSRDSSGNNIGGERLLSGSIEIDYLPWGNFGFAVFYDAGDATQANSLSLKHSAGLGFRYRSPIGMVRIDLAHPFDRVDEREEKDVRLHISIGPDL